MYAITVAVLHTFVTSMQCAPPVVVMSRLQLHYQQPCFSVLLHLTNVNITDSWNIRSPAPDITVTILLLAQCIL